MEVLTREQIENMDAGPEMNAAIHEGVMGLQLQNHSILKHGGTWVGCRYVDPPPAYSTDIAAAMGVADKLIAEGNHTTLESCFVVDDHLAETATPRFWFKLHEYYDLPPVEAMASTRQVAICRAALLRALEQEQSK